MTDKPLREALDDWPEPEGSFDEVLERAAQGRFGQPEPTLTASEVRVLTEAALRLGRKEAGEEIARALEKAAHCDYDAADDLHWAAERALAISSQPSDAISDATSGVPGHQEVSEAVRSPQEPRPGVTCKCPPEACRCSHVTKGNTP